MPYRTARWYFLGVGLLVAAGTLQQAGVLHSASGVATLLVTAAMAIAMVPDGRGQGRIAVASADSCPDASDPLAAREAQARAEVVKLRQLVNDAGCLVVEFDISVDPGWFEQPEKHNPPLWKPTFFDEQAARRLVDVEMTTEMSDYLHAIAFARYMEDDLRISHTANEALGSNQEVYSQEYRVTNRKGELQWLGETMYLTVLGPGHWRVIGTIIDITSRKLAEDARHASEMRLRRALNQARALVFEGEVTAPTDWRNDPFHAAYNWDFQILDEAAGRNMIDLEADANLPFMTALAKSRHPDEHATMHVRFIKALLEGKDSYSQEYRCRDRHGRWRWMYESISLKCVDENAWRFIGTVMDITDRKQAEELARISAERLRQTLSHARAFLFEGEVNAPPDWATRNGTDGFEWKLRLVDPQAAARLLALETPAGGEMDFGAILALQSPEDHARWQERFRMAIDRNLPSYTQDYPITNSVGTPLWLTQTVRLTQIGPTSWHLSGLVVDGEANRLAKDDLCAVMRHAGCIIWAGRIHVPAEMTDIAHWIWDVEVVDEEAAQCVLPLDTTGQSYRNTWIAARLPEYWAESNRLFTEAIAHANYRFRHEFRCRDRYGVIHWISQDVHLDQVDAKVWRLTAVCVNANVQKNVEAALQEARNAAEQANAAKTAFLASMSHEIRTPMTAILGYADLLVDAATPEAEKVRYVETIRRNGEHLLAIINDILDLSKIEAGRFTVENIPTSPRQIAREVLQILQPQADAKSIKLQLQIASDVPENIHSDPTRLRQILLNLANNAVKFTLQGSVSLRLTMQPLPRPQLRMEVTDTGIGMSQEQLGRIFTPFQQSDVAVSRRFGGTGLGLAIAQRLARMLGGDVSVNSELDRGSTFAVWVDAVAVAAPTHSDLRPAATTKVSLAGVRILLAEDGMDNRRLISFHLHRAGCEVTSVEDGRQACDLAMEALAQGKPFQIILMDMQMPVMDGYTATRELRTRGYNLPIIALTAHAMTGDRERCLEIGCNDYAAKPVNVPLMLQMLGQQLA